jgi:hypothetical protein
MLNVFSLVGIGARSIGVYSQHTANFNDLMDIHSKNENIQQSSSSMLKSAFGRVSHHLQESINVAKKW